mgnify:CR=1 FL=1
MTLNTKYKNKIMKSLFKLSIITLLFFVISCTSEKENNPNYLVSKPQELVDLLIPSTSYTQTKV